MFDISPERPDDEAAIDSLLDAAFAPGRFAKASYRYRDGVAPEPHLRFVARRDDRLIGTVRCWPVQVGDGAAPALLLGPLAVDSRHRCLGVGAALMRQVLDMAAAREHRLVFLVGDQAYYRRFGFRPAAPLGFYMPDERPERLMVYELMPGALARAPGGVLEPWRWLRQGRLGPSALGSRLSPPCPFAILVSRARGNAAGWIRRHSFGDGRHSGASAV